MHTGIKVNRIGLYGKVYVTLTPWAWQMYLYIHAYPRCPILFLECHEDYVINEMGKRLIRGMERKNVTI